MGSRVIFRLTHVPFRVGIFRAFKMHTDPVQTSEGVSFYSTLLSPVSSSFAKLVFTPSPVSFHFLQTTTLTLLYTTRHGIVYRKDDLYLYKPSSFAIQCSCRLSLRCIFLTLPCIHASRLTSWLISD